MTQSHTCPQSRPERDTQFPVYYAQPGEEIQHGKTRPVAWVSLDEAEWLMSSGAAVLRTGRGKHLQLTGHKLRCNGGQFRDASATMNAATMFKLAGMPDSPFKRRLLNAWKN